MDWAIRDGRITPDGQLAGTDATALVADFLASRVLDSDLRVSTLKGYRAAIVAALRVNGAFVDDALLTSLMTGLSNQHPASAARYEGTWDIDRLLDYYQSRPEPTALIDVRRRAIALAATALVARASDLERISSIEFADTHVDVRMFRTKNDTGETATTRVPYLPSNLRRVCAARALRDYAALTRDQRHPAHPSVFLALARSGPDKVHMPIDAKTIAQEIRRAMAAAGIDTSHFKPHSIRGASSTKAVEAGESIDDVAQFGRWRSTSVFKQFYLRATNVRLAVATSILTPR